MQSTCRSVEVSREGLPLFLSKSAQCEGNSRLMQLPAEVRAIILRELLYSVKPLHNASAMEESDLFHVSRGRKRPARRAFSFYPAVLRTCQLIYHEGYSILYKENTLSIYVGLKGLPQVTILDNRIRIMADLCCKFQSVLDGMPEEDGYDEVVYRQTIRWIPHILRRMSKVQLTIIAGQQSRLEPPDRRLYDFCRFMEAALRGKSVDAMLIQPWLPECLRAFSILRCQQFTIRSWNTGAECPNWMVEDHDFYETITSSRPVFDSMQVYSQLVQHVDSICDEGVLHDVSDERVTLYEEAFLFNQDSFNSAAKDVLARLEKRYEKRMKRDQRFAWQRYDLDNAWDVLANI